MIILKINFNYISLVVSKFVRFNLSFDIFANVYTYMYATFHLR